MDWILDRRAWTEDHCRRTCVTPIVSCTRAPMVVRPSELCLILQSKVSTWWIDSLIGGISPNRSIILVSRLAPLFSILHASFSFPPFWASASFWVRGPHHPSGFCFYSYMYCYLLLSIFIRYPSAIRRAEDWLSQLFGSGYGVLVTRLLRYVRYIYIYICIHHSFFKSTKKINGIILINLKNENQQ